MAKLCDHGYFLEVAPRSCPKCRTDTDLALREEICALRAELERERMRLAACGVVAMANTPESAARARDIHPDYRSASCDDVARIVDSEMSLRAENADLLTDLDRVLTTLRYLIGIAERGEGRPMADGDRTRDNRNHNSGTDTGAERAGGPFS